MTLDHQGWQDDKFLLGTTLIGTGYDERVNVTLECGRIAAALKGYNNLAKWSSLSDTLFASGTEARGFSLLAAFAAPLLSVLGEGGMTVCLVTEQKHQADMLYAGVQSVWGRQQGLHIPRAVAFHKKFEILKACGNLPCVFPDLFVTDPSVVTQFLEAVLAQNGLLLSSSKRWLERDLAFRKSGPRSEERRVLEIPLPLSTPQTDAELTSVYHNNFGKAGEKFIRYVAFNRTFIRQHLMQYRDSVSQRMGERVNEKLIVNFLACIGMAAKVCDTLGVLHVTPSRMQEFAEGVMEGLRAKDYEARHLPELTLRDYFTSHLDAILVMQGDAIGPQKDRLIYDGAAPTEIRYEILRDTLYFSRPAFKEWCETRHVGGDRLVHELAGMGVARNTSSMRNLRSRHPQVSYRPNPRTTVVEVDTKHPLIVEHIKRLEETLKIVRGPKGIYRHGGVHAEAVAPAPSEPPPA